MSRKGDSAALAMAVSLRAVEKRVPKLVNKHIREHVAPGGGIAAAAITNGDLLISLTDGRTLNVGPVVGGKGRRGSRGPRGQFGKGGFGFRWRGPAVDGQNYHPQDGNPVNPGQADVVRCPEGGNLYVCIRATTMSPLTEPESWDLFYGTE